ncbi:hypothetical protein KY334_05250 [Candidatus Woesearchaeota archaeon]|nr:hypothetical protein [Candidatus Woesearchaeota archaeon]
MNKDKVKPLFYKKNDLYYCDLKCELLKQHYCEKEKCYVYNILANEYLAFCEMFNGISKLYNMFGYKFTNFSRANMSVNWLKQYYFKIQNGYVFYSKEEGNLLNLNSTIFGHYITTDGNILKLQKDNVEVRKVIDGDSIRESEDEELMSVLYEQDNSLTLLIFMKDKQR